MPIGVRKRVLNYALWAACEAIGKTRQTIVDEIGISLGSLYKYMSLKEYPSKKMQVKIADYFLVDEADLFPEDLEPIRYKRQPKPEFITIEDALSMGLIEPANDPWEEEMANDSLADQLTEILAKFSDRERFVIERRYGLNGCDSHTLDELVPLMGITRERVRQIEQKALSRLRHPHRSKGLLSYIEA